MFNLLHKEIGHINPHVLYVFHSGPLFALFTRNQLALRFLTHYPLTTHYLWWVSIFSSEYTVHSTHFPHTHTEIAHLQTFTKISLSNSACLKLKFDILVPLAEGVNQKVFQTQIMIKEKQSLHLLQFDLHISQLTLYWWLSLIFDKLLEAQYSGWRQNSTVQLQLSWV